MESQQYEASLLACPACGAQIGGTGNCPSCGQLSVVTKNHKLLSIKDEDIKDIRIKAPTQEQIEKSENPSWQIAGSSWGEDSLMVLSGGDPKYGADMVAFYFAKHPESTIPGSRIPDIDKIEMYVLATAIKQSLNKK